MTDTISSLEAHLGYWMRRVSNQVSGAFARALEARGCSVAEWVALRHLHEHGRLAPAELAERVGMTRGAVSKILDKLEARGWVGRKPSPDDGRSHTVSLSAAGRRVLPSLARLADENDARFFDCLGAREQARLRLLLQKVAEHHGWTTVPID
jgi:DNA-binding MarR family transcriptional regulator